MLILIIVFLFVCLAGKSFSRVNTLPTEKINGGKLEHDLNPPKLERSKTERQQNKNILASEAAQIFDNNISVQQKVYFLICVLFLESLVDIFGYIFLLIINSLFAGNPNDWLVKTCFVVMGLGKLS